jgi:hypothetical protein
MNKSKIFFSLFALILYVIGCGDAHTQPVSVHGRIIARYSVQGAMIETPFSNLLVQLRDRRSPNIFSALTDANGNYYFYAIPMSEYDLVVYFGRETLSLDRNIRDGVINIIGNTYYSINISSDNYNVGSIVILKDNIRSMNF